MHPGGGSGTLPSLQLMITSSGLILLLILPPLGFVAPLVFNKPGGSILKINKIIIVAVVDVLIFCHLNPTTFSSRPSIVQMSWPSGSAARFSSLLLVGLGSDLTEVKSSSFPSQSSRSSFYLSFLRLACSTRCPFIWRKSQWSRSTRIPLSSGVIRRRHSLQKFFLNT